MTLLVGHRKASGQGGARFGGLRIVRLAAFEHGPPLGWLASGVVTMLRPNTGCRVGTTG